MLTIDVSAIRISVGAASSDGLDSPCCSEAGWLSTSDRVSWDGNDAGGGGCAPQACVGKSFASTFDGRLSKALLSLRGPKWEMSLCVEPCPCLDAPLGWVLLPPPVL